MKETNTNNEIDELLKKIEDPTVENIKDPSLCPVQGCKTKITLTGILCNQCEKKYCIKHRLPEDHSKICKQRINKAEQQQFKNESFHFIAKERKESGSGNKTTMEEDHIALEKKFKSQLKKKQNQRKKKTSKGKKK
ncbi:hypothetical protein H8356DRAFT_1673472 [Neocallimastix lanati (nom. inval.)]|jgi:hypothetical protein|uniref:AN1-type domain-containing protein n=1 Tax=Neocallimastix californiae TaxID=1754190 RepID=A0A1Y2CMV4_9FUNG|nr:hypothetical protein H8356DRAFT_1673472 [Neocallimastix sp. JGI-2020a]ORY48361.1 hypothetical protein LY90DRAFT_703157 [Neocallimastix californiae]|eukprot:ORY48361.1 hypothetical protein LY90DRAFT_703157 [Neocallimastix californiae]